MNWYALLPFAGFVANIILAAVVYARSPRAAPNRLYALFALALAYWSLLTFTQRLVNDAQAALTLYRVSALGWCTLPALYLHFVLAFTADNRHFSRALIGGLHALGGLFALSVFVPGAMVVEMVDGPWGFSAVPGQVYWIFMAYFITTFGIAVVLLSKMHFRARRQGLQAEAAQCAFLIGGIAFPLVGSILTNMVLPVLGFRVLELGEVLATVNAGTIAYAMRHHRLLGLGIEQAAETIIRTMGDALLVVNRDNKIVLANGATSKILGIAQTALIGEPVMRFVRSTVVTAPGIDLGGSLRVGEGDFVPLRGETVPVMLSVSPVHDRDGQLVGQVCVARDIRELRRAMLDLAAANDRLEQLSVIDELTGVSNRRLANLRIGEELRRSARHGRPFSVGILDLDDFKRINDAHGHASGDRLLQVVAGVLRASVRNNDIVARWGGDEFMILLYDTPAEGARVVGDRIVAGIAGVAVPGVDLQIRASLGIAAFEPQADGTGSTAAGASQRGVPVVGVGGTTPRSSPAAGPSMDVQLLIRRADEVLYRAKQEGKSRVCITTVLPYK